MLICANNQFTVHMFPLDEVVKFVLANEESIIGMFTRFNAVAEMNLDFSPSIDKLFLIVNDFTEFCQCIRSQYSRGDCSSGTSSPNA
jgi:hypothetical protein